MPTHYSREFIAAATAGSSAILLGNIAASGEVASMATFGGAIFTALGAVGLSIERSEHRWGELTAELPDAPNLVRVKDIPRRIGYVAIEPTSAESLDKYTLQKRFPKLVDASSRFPATKNYLIQAFSDDLYVASVDMTRVLPFLEAFPPEATDFSSLRPDLKHRFRDATETHAEVVTVGEFLDGMMPINRPVDDDGTRGPRPRWYDYIQANTWTVQARTAVIPH